MIGVPAFPVGKYDYARPLLADDSRHLQPALPGVLHSTIRNIERLPPGKVQDAGRLGSFSGALRSRTARAHFPLGQIENADVMSKLCHFEQGAAAGLLDVVPVRSYGEYVERGRSH